MHKASQNCLGGAAAEYERAFARLADQASSAPRAWPFHSISGQELKLDTSLNLHDHPVAPDNEEAAAQPMANPDLASNCRSRNLLPSINFLLCETQAAIRPPTTSGWTNPRRMGALRLRPIAQPESAAPSPSPSRGDLTRAPAGFDWSERAHLPRIPSGRFSPGGYYRAR